MFEHETDDYGQTLSDILNELNYADYDELDEFDYESMLEDELSG